MLLSTAADAFLMTKFTKLALLLALLSSAACSAPNSPGPEIPTLQEPLGSSSAPEMAPTQWKERLRVLYIYLECTGDYRNLGSSMQSFLDQAKASKAKPAGAPFALFYDDPGVTPLDQLRSRLCLPVEDVPPSGSLSYDVLPRAMVVYSTVRGAYPDLPKIYPTLLGYMHEKSWVAAGPIREIYLTSPAAVSSYAELIAEVQIPWKPGR